MQICRPKCSLSELFACWANRSRWL